SIIAPGTIFSNIRPWKIFASCFTKSCGNSSAVHSTSGSGKAKANGPNSERREMNRIEILNGFLQKDPDDSFSRYALALEYVKSGQSDDARREFETVMAKDPGYVATYYQLGQLYRTLGLKHEAEKTYRAGITAASKAGDAHTQSELEGAVESLLME